MVKRLDRLRPDCAPYIQMAPDGNGHRLKNIGPVRHHGKHFNPRLTGAILEVLGGQHFIEILDMICRKKLLYTKIKFIN